MKKDIVLFGAGTYGKMAIEHYGDERVIYFVDNNPQKVGTVFCGKDVLSFSELLNISLKVQIIISSSYSSGIATQLKDNGLNKYLTFCPSARTSLTMQRAIERLLKYDLLKTFKFIALYGFEVGSLNFIQNLKLSYIGENIKYMIAENVDDILIYDINNLNDGGLNVVSGIDAVLADIDCIIIALEENHQAVKAMLEKKYGAVKTIIDPFHKIAFYETDEVVLNKNEIVEYNDKTKKSDDQLEEKRVAKLVKNIGNFVNIVKENVPLFNFIELETVNRCNGTCSFCPANKNIDKRKLEFMDFNLYKKIVHQLSEINYSGFFAPFSTGEPFIDDRIIEFVEYAKKRLPNAHIYLYSNGTLLTLKKFKELMIFLDELVIDNYTTDLKLLPTCKEIEEYIIKNPQFNLQNKVTINLRNPNDVLTTRGGTSPNKVALNIFPDVPCPYPFRQIVVRPNGKVSLCCADYLGKHEMGDLTKDSIMDVWFGEKFTKMRNVLAGGRINIDMCKECDVLYLF
jgi:radical SAM protein with 4Fe4S-binding SPASM domain